MSNRGFESPSLHYFDHNETNMRVKLKSFRNTIVYWLGFTKSAPLEVERGDGSIYVVMTKDMYDTLKYSLATIEDPRPPVEILLWCPDCGERHIDQGEWAKKPHHTHSCQHCGMTWRPALENTVGVQFLSGFKN